MHGCNLESAHSQNVSLSQLYHNNDVDVFTQRICILFKQYFYSIRWKEQWSNILWRRWIYHWSWNVSYLWLPMFCIRCMAAIWNQHIPKMGSTVTTWDLRWTFTSTCRNISNCYQSKNRPGIASILYCLRRFIHNISIYEQNRDYIPTVDSKPGVRIIGIPLLW